MSWLLQRFGRSLVIVSGVGPFVNISPNVTAKGSESAPLVSGNIHDLSCMVGSSAQQHACPVLCSDSANRPFFVVVCLLVCFMKSGRYEHLNLFKSVNDAVGFGLWGFWCLWCGGEVILDVFLNKLLLTPCCRSRETRLLLKAERLSCVSLRLIILFRCCTPARSCLHVAFLWNELWRSNLVLGLLCPYGTERKYRKQKKKKKCTFADLFLTGTRSWTIVQAPQDPWMDTVTPHRFWIVGITQKWNHYLNTELVEPVELVSGLVTLRALSLFCDRFWNLCFPSRLFGLMWNHLLPGTAEIRRADGGCLHVFPTLQHECMNDVILLNGGDGTEFRPHAVILFFHDSLFLQKCVDLSDDSMLDINVKKQEH